MGKILTIGGEKGGCSKSSLCQSLGVLLHQKGNRVLLVDSDPQQTTYFWSQDRMEFQPEERHISCVCLYGETSKQLLAHKRDYDWVVVDTSGADSKALRSAAIVSDFMLTPLRPKRRDLNTLSHMRDLVINQIMAVNPRLITRMVFTQCPTLPSQVSRILGAKETASDFGFDVLNAITYTRNAYDDAEEDGLSVLEYNDPKAAEEIENIYQEFLVKNL